MCQFSQSDHLVNEAVCVLDRMDPATEYPKMIGYHLVRDLMVDCEGTLPRCINIYNSVSDDQQRARICEKSLDIHFILKVAEMAQ